MKKFYVTFVLALTISFGGFAQTVPAITSANNFNIGESSVLYMADTTNIVPGPGGANVTWDFTGLQAVSPTDSVISKFQSVSSTPYPTDFPSAQLATATVSGQGYGFLTYQNSTYTIVGEVEQQTSNGQTVTLKEIFDKPEVLYSFPLTYQTNQNSTYAVHYDLRGSTVYRNGALNVTGDGYGTLKIMNKTYNNVLRIHAITNEADTVGGLPGYEIDYTIESWSYLTPGKKDNILTISITTITEFGTMVGSAKSVTYNINGTTLGVDHSNKVACSVSLYPNPTKQHCRLSIASQADGHSDIQVINQLGQVVKNINNLDLRTGQNNFNLDLSGVPSGIYYVKINSGNESQVQKLVVK